MLRTPGGFERSRVDLEKKGLKSNCLVIAVPMRASASGLWRK